MKRRNNKSIYKSTYLKISFSMQRMELFINLKVGRDIWIDVTEKKKKKMGFYINVSTFQI